MVGAVTAALFIEKFVKTPVKWAHIDSYAWNDSARPGIPRAAKHVVYALFITQSGSIVAAEGAGQPPATLFGLKTFRYSYDVALG